MDWGWDPVHPHPGWNVGPGQYFTSKGIVCTIFLLLFSLKTMCCWWLTNHSVNWRKFEAGVRRKAGHCSFLSIPCPLREAVARCWKRELLKTLWGSQDWATLEWRHYTNTLAMTVKFCSREHQWGTVPWWWQMGKMSMAMSTVSTVSSGSRPVLQLFWGWPC